ncbi:RNA polymerase sigma-70 factor [Maribellus comscasis]|uniref:RNA polymerase sigma-70 factor n=1 Tax=Maribellus comscasis TaxID=2681766 RepID=A0A6I6JTR6_9BACT|nr:RNA polymerase sigma-70 factor [Maribellus comscasis]QGY44639.1 RNA polymerase sigma-70 factor [Maribellus comscasis]
MGLANFDDMDRDKKLISLISCDNQLAFKQIFDLYHVRLFHFAKKYLKSEHLAEEAVQDVFLRLWEKRKELGKVEDFSSWLFQLTRNHVLNILKRAANENRIKEQIRKTLNTYEEHIDKQLFEKESLTILHDVIATLPSQRQEIFRLCRFEEKSYEETAQIMGISKSTVNDHMVKAMKYIKNKFPKEIYE